VAKKKAKRAAKKKKTKNKNSGGRPEIISKELIEEICKHVKVGNYQDTSAAKCGVSKFNFLKWIKIGVKKPNTIYGRFIKAMNEAEAEAEINDLAKLTDEASIRWRLSRRHPKKWGPKQIIKIEDNDTKDSSFSNAEFRERLYDLGEEIAKKNKNK